MTNPFQSITEPDERKSFEDALEVFPVPGRYATGVAAEDALFGHSDLDGRVETGLGNVGSLLVAARRARMARPDPPTRQEPRVRLARDPQDRRNGNHCAAAYTALKRH